MEIKSKNLYYVGGVVRDELLGLESPDIDYCYEGDAIKFAQRKFGKNTDAIIKTNQAFGTVNININGDKIDIASTREEKYPRKGHLPQVYNIGCPLIDDLKRRDFTINAMAKNTASKNKIIDYFGGREDLENGLLRVLHKESFIDDPTRIVRGLKFAVRFGFELEDETKRLQDEYLENINYDMSYHRLKKELVETFSLNKQEAYDMFISQGIYKLLGPNQKVPDINTSIEKLIDEYPCKYSWLIYLAQFDLSNLELTRYEKKILEWAKRLQTEEPNNNTPFESILIHRLRLKSVYDTELG